jgi:hypothetical protein
MQRQSVVNVLRAKGEEGLRFSVLREVSREVGGRRMFIVGLVSMLAGVVLGLHFRVLILFPAIALACAVIAALGVVGRDASWWGAIVMLVAAAALQTGYLVGATRAVLAGTRAPALSTAS